MKASSSSAGLPSTAPSRATTVSAAITTASMPACSRTARAFSAEMRRTSSSGGSSRSMCSSISGVTMRKFFIPMRSKSSRRRGDWEARMISILLFLS